MVVDVLQIHHKEEKKERKKETIIALPFAPVCHSISLRDDQ
jgi:hypothetical protein